MASTLTFGWSDSPVGRRCLRAMASGFVRRALEVKSVPLPQRGLRAILVVSPHPDDESLGCGGTVALMTRRGIEVHVVFMTDGSASHPGHPRVGQQEIAEIRHAEALRATSTLGIAKGKVTFLGAADGTLASLRPKSCKELENRIADVITSLRPEAILVTCRRDGSSEHDATFKMVAAATKRAKSGSRILEFPIWAWRNPVLLLDAIVFARAVWSVDISAVANVKALAIRCHASQVFPLPPDTMPVLPPDFALEFQSRMEYFFER